MSGDTNADDSRSRTETKYSTDLTPSDEGVTSLRDAEEEKAKSVSSTRHTAENKGQETPEDNSTVAYEFGTLPPTFTMVINPKAWHPSWGPVPVGYEAIVSRTKATLSAPGKDSYGTTDDGQPVARDNAAEARATYAGISPGIGVEFGSGWQPRWVPDWQIMERQLAETGVNLSGSGGDRLEAALGEKQIERERQNNIPSQEDVHAFYSPDEPLSEDSNVITLWDEADDKAVTKIESILGETGDTTDEILSMPEAIEEVRSYTKECSARRARDCREAVGEMNIENATQPNFRTFDYNGNQTNVSKQAKLRAPAHRPFHRDFGRRRPLGGFDPKWGSWKPDTEMMSVGPNGDVEIEVATDPIRPIADIHVAHAEKRALRDRFGESTLQTLEQYVVRIFDRLCESTGVPTEETYYSDLSDENVEAHPANDSAAVTVNTDGSISRTTDATAPCLPTMSRLRETYEQALTDTRDPLAAVGSTLERLWHVGTQSLAEIQPEWPGCSVLARVTRAYVPNDPSTQQQVVYLEDVAPSATAGTQIGDEVKFTVWKQSYQDVLVAEGDILAISNPVPGEFNGSLTLAATGKTTITRLVKSNGPIKRAMDARGKLNGANDGTQRVGDTGPAPAVGGVIGDNDDEVTRLPNKRYRRVGATLRRGPPRESKQTRVHRPMRERRCPMTWTFPVTDWVREHSPIPEVGESVQRDEVVGYCISTTNEPTDIDDQNSVELTRDKFISILERLTVDSSPRAVGNRPFDADDPGASIKTYDDPSDLGGIDSLTAVVSPHPDARQSTNIRVHSGIPLSDEDTPTTIRIVEWDRESDSPKTVLSPITHTMAWETRMLNKIREVRNPREDALQESESSSPNENKPTSGRASEHPEAAGEASARSTQKERSANNEESAESGDHSFVVGKTEDGTDIVDMSKL